MTLLRTFEDAVRRDPDAIALVDGRGTRSSFGDLWGRANALAASWHRAGLRPGDRAVLAMPLGIDLYASLAGLWLLEATAVLSEPATGLAGLRHAARATGARAYLSGGTAFGLLRWALPELRALPLHLRAGRATYEGRRDALDDPAGAALISFTSGSTGTPKAILRTHGFLAAQDAALSGLLSHGAGHGADLVAFPVFALSNLGKGVTSVLPPWDPRRHADLDPAATAAFMDRHGVSRLLAPPAALEALLAAPPPGRLATVLTGGGPVYPDLVARLERWKPGIEVVSAYGSTEAEPIAHRSNRDPSPPDGPGIFAGRPVDAARVRVVDGEIQVAGDHVVQGYLDPADDASTKLREDGVTWHRTGDAGVLDARGLWLLGRHGADVAGVHPFVVEAEARTWPGVRQAALGVGPGGAATLALSGDPARLLDWERLAAPFAPLRIAHVGAVPMDRRHGSKIDRKALDALLGGAAPGMVHSGRNGLPAMPPTTSSRLKLAGLLALALAVVAVGLLGVLSDRQEPKILVAVKTVDGRQVATVTGPPIVLSRAARCRLSPGVEGATANGLEIDWGDGTAPTPPGEPGADCSASQAVHAYAAPGTYTVRVRVFHARKDGRIKEDWAGEAPVTVPATPRG